MSADPHKVLLKILPQFLPDKADPGHIQVRRLHKSLQGELPGIQLVPQLLLARTAKSLDEVDDCLLVQEQRVLENGVEHLLRHRLSNKVAVSLVVLFF